MELDRLSHLPCIAIDKEFSNIRPGSNSTKLLSYSHCKGLAGQVAKSLFCTKRILIFVKRAGQSEHGEHIRSEVSTQDCGHLAGYSRRNEQRSIHTLREDSKTFVLARMFQTVLAREPMRCHRTIYHKEVGHTIWGQDKSDISAELVDYSANLPAVHEALPLPRNYSEQPQTSHLPVEQVRKSQRK
jgi:hypothetical protein